MMHGDYLNLISPSHGLFVSLFLGGLVGGATHCSGMCGPLVLGQIGALPAGLQGRKAVAARLLLPYHLGRVTTYTMLALVLGVFVHVFTIIGVPKELLAVPLLSMAALIFMVSAVPGLATLFPWAVRLSVPVAGGVIGKISKPLMMNPAGWRGYALGLLLGFMPCGLVMAALMAAGTAPNAAGTALAMAGFGLGTMPVLMTLGLGGTWIKQKWPVQMRAISSIIMVVNSLMLFRLATQMVI